MKKSGFGTVVLIGIIVFIIGVMFSNVNGDNFANIFNNTTKNNYIRIISSNDNKDLEENLKAYARKEKITLDFTYKGDLEIIDELNHNPTEYDAVWISNSLWLYMLDNSYLTSDSASISISPIVLGVKESKAKELGLIGKENVTNNDILNLVQSKKISYVMSSVTATNDGASAYLGFLNSLAGSPEVLRENMLNDRGLLDKIRNLFKGVQRVSGDQNFLEEMFVKSNEYEAVIASESSLISINNKLKNQNKETLYLIYPVDGVPINDSAFAFIDNGYNKEDAFLKIQRYLLSSEGQEILKGLGRRTWYGGVNEKAPKDVFKKEWGIDTGKYLVATKYPSKEVINKAFDIYIEELRKPSHTVFCLDYSGSMYGDGENALKDAMEYILTYQEARKDRLQFSKYDKVTIIPFSTRVIDVWEIDNTNDTTALVQKIRDLYPDGGTNLYAAIAEGLQILESESNDYTKTVIAMTDGKVNYGSFSELNDFYKIHGHNVPIYNIMFGSADKDDLTSLANMSNAKVFDGRTNLLSAFKEVRGYN